ncbi:Detected protein of confused Function [Hibiscus syriacus]|uniref:Detected protein of confused Function n=1 Tax=Hibiscus syriacus TaxID=106335 RepID=A0A6A2ZWW5_HIBSY|nr:Detected protein of confused Function [Hibiscus syriacus]
MFIKRIQHKFLFLFFSTLFCHHLLKDLYSLLWHCHLNPCLRSPLISALPPPSPVASGRRSSVTNEDVLSDFLQHSLGVPDLVLPDKVFPRQNFIDNNPPKLDFQLLSSLETDSLPKVLDSIARTGCFQLVNYGIQADCIRSALGSAAAIFQLPPEKRTAMTRSPEKLYGFEEPHGEKDGEVEEFVWCKGEGLKLAMDKIWPVGYSNFSDKMEALLSDIEKVAEKILGIISQSFPPKTGYENGMMEGQGAICRLYKHKQDVSGEKCSGTLRYDVIKMLIKGFDYSHALCLHVCDGSSEFHVYSKKGWVSFCPDKDALVITVGDQTQALSGGQFKHVIGRPIYKGEKEDCISMAFLYSPPSTAATAVAATTTIARVDPQKWNTISLSRQAMAAIVLTLVYYILVYLYNKF